MLSKINPGTVSKRNAENQRGPTQIRFPRQHLGKHGEKTAPPKKGPDSRQPFETLARPHLGPFREHFEIILLSFWDTFATLVGPFCASSLCLLLVFLASAFCLCLLLVPLSSAACLCTLLAPLASASCFSFRPLVFASCGCPLRVLPRLVIISFRCASPQL